MIFRRKRDEKADVKVIEVEATLQVETDKHVSIGLLGSGRIAAPNVCKDVVGLEPGDTATVVIVKHERKLEPPKAERKECARVQGQRSRKAYVWFACEDCGAGVGCETEECPACGSHLTHTIPWAEFRGDC